MGISRGLARRTAGGFAIRGLGLVGGLMTSVVLARVLGPEEYGLYAFAIAVIGMLAMPVLVGLPTLLVRETAASLAQDQLGRLGTLSQWALRVICFGALAVIGLVLALALIWPAMRADARFVVLLAALPMVPILALGQARSAILRGLGHLSGGLVPEALVRPAVLVAALGVMAVVAPGPITALHALACLILAGLVAFAVGAWLLYRIWPATSERVPFEASWRQAILPLSLIGGLQTINTNVDLVLIGLLRDAAEAGQYRIAVSGATLGLFVLTTLRIVLQPQIARLSATGDLARLQRVISHAALAATGASLVALGVIAVFGAELIGLVFGARYEDAAGPLTILLAGNVALSVFAMGTPVLTMSGAERSVLPGLAISAVLNLLLNLWLIPTHGALGAAGATAVALGLGQWVTYRMAHQGRGIDASPWPLIQGGPRPWLLRGEH